LNNGGVSVLDYDIYYDQGQAINSFMLLDEAVLTQHYQTTVSLIAGETYSFKVTARNTVGDSDLSQMVTILAAKIPDAPLSLQNVEG
jgi:2-C-methyl-D-erythritol 4-phosphate cytidylyltransferase